MPKVLAIVVVGVVLSSCSIGSNNASSGSSNNNNSSNNGSSNGSSNNNSSNGDTFSGNIKVTIKVNVAGASTGNGDFTLTTGSDGTQVSTLAIVDSTLVKSKVVTVIASDPTDQNGQRLFTYSAAGAGLHNGDFKTGKTSGSDVQMSLSYSDTAADVNLSDSSSGQCDVTVTKIDKTGFEAQFKCSDTNGLKVTGSISGTPA